MKRYSKMLALFLSLAMSLPLLTGCGGDGKSTTTPTPAADGKTEVKVQTLQWGFTPPDGSMDHQWHKTVGDKITEYTNGAVVYEYYPNSTLGNEKVALEGVLSGTINQASISPNVVATVLPEFNVLCLPFVFDNLDHFFAVISSDEYYKKVNEAANKIGLQYLGLDYAVPRNIATKVPVHTPADANGQILRVMDGTIYTDMMSAWGFGSAVISYGEVYTAVQQGVVDGIENSNDGNLIMKFDEVIDYATNTDHVYHGQSTFMNLDLWNSLSQEARDGIEKAWKENYPVMVEAIRDYPKEMEDAAAAKGVTMIDLDEETRQTWVDASQPIHEKYRGVIGEDFYDWFIELAEAKRP